jgi:hypothetical protein
VTDAPAVGAADRAPGVTIRLDKSNAGDNDTRDQRRDLIVRIPPIVSAEIGAS